MDAAKASFTYYGNGDEPLEMTTFADAAAFSAEVAFDKNAKGFFNSACQRTTWENYYKLTLM